MEKVISGYLSSNVEFGRNEQSSLVQTPENFFPERKILQLVLCKGFKIRFYFVLV